MVAIKRSLPAVAALVFALTAVASQPGSRNDGSRWIQLKEPAVISGVSIRPGSYTLSWAREPGSEDVRIAVAHGKKILANGTGRWMEGSRPSPNEALVFNGEGGTKELTEIRFWRSVDSIRIEAGSTRADAGQPEGARTR